MLLHLTDVPHLQPNLPSDSSGLIKKAVYASVVSAQALVCLNSHVQRVSAHNCPAKKLPQEDEC